MFFYWIRHTFWNSIVLSADTGMHYAFTPQNHLYGNVNFTVHSEHLDIFF